MNGRNMIFPDMEQGDRVKVETLPAKRGEIHDRMVGIGSQWRNTDDWRGAQDLEDSGDQGNTC